MTRKRINDVTSHIVALYRRRRADTMRQFEKFRKPGAMNAVRPRRFLSHRADETTQFLEAAREYVVNKQPGEVDWLYRKPYDVNPGNPEFFTEMYDVLGLIKAMRIRPFGRVLEVGSGPGWVTEMLALLGFEVDAIEPAADMIAIARQRIAGAFECYHVSDPPEVRFHETTLEDCPLPDGVFDGALFYASLHHVVDEERGLAQVFRLLKPGGVIGVGESAWTPGDRDLESKLEEEINRFGTLESPFTREYLEELLADTGFFEVERYHLVNGPVPEHLGTRPVMEVAQAPAAATNNLTARKPGRGEPTTVDLDTRTEAHIEVLRARREDDLIRLTVSLKNTGNSTWLAGGQSPGSVNVALRSGNPGAGDFVEGTPRTPLVRRVAPGETVHVEEATFTLPPGSAGRSWVVDLVNERMFWFSTHGTRPGTLSG